MKCLLLLAAFAFCVLPSFAQWHFVRSNTTKSIADMYFKNKDTGYCISTDGSVLQSTNAGEDWNFLFQDTGLYIQQSIVAGRDSVFCYGSGFFGGWNRVAFSYGGCGRVKQAVPVSISNPVFFNDRISTDSYTYSNGIYTPHSIPPSAATEELRYSGNRVIGSNASTIVFSSDYGTTWTVKTYMQPQLTSGPYYGYFNGDTLIAVTNYPTIIHTSYNRGSTWTAMPTSIPGPTLHFVTARTIVAVYQYQPDTIVYTSADGGATFSGYKLPLPISNIYFLDDQTGFLFGDNGVIYKTTTSGGTTGIHPMLVGEDQLIIYPNPAAETIGLRYNDPTLSIQSIGITGSNGQQLMRFPPTVTTLSITGIPPGTYFLNIVTNRGEVHRKIIKK